MYPRAYHLLLLADYAIGGFFAMLVFAAGLFAFSVGGGLMKGHELRAMGAAYTGFLASLESEARQLRAEYCAHADPAAFAQANCGGGLAEDLPRLRRPA